MAGKEVFKPRTLFISLLFGRGLEKMGRMGRPKDFGGERAL
jgi:hypothetical protein